jgi:hypothetical protein
MPTQQQRDPDTTLVAVFKIIAMPNPAKTLTAGRPIFDDMDVCEIRIPGSRNSGVYPATSISHWDEDPETGEQVPVTYAERFSRQYRQFGHSVGPSGTPLDHAFPYGVTPRRTEGAEHLHRRAAGHDRRAGLKNLGVGSRAEERRGGSISGRQRAAPNVQLQAELENLRARNQLKGTASASRRRRRRGDSPTCRSTSCASTSRLAGSRRWGATGTR